MKKKKLPEKWLDMNVYKSESTLRLPFCFKYDSKTGKVDNDSQLITECDMKDVCVTYIEGYTHIETPMCFSKKPIIDFENPINNINIGDSNWSESYKEAMSCLTPED